MNQFTIVAVYFITSSFPLWIHAPQKLHERKLARLSEVDEQFYVTMAYLLEIAARGSELFMAAEPNEKRELIGLLGQNLLLGG